MGITLIMWKISPLDGKRYPPEKLVSFICFTKKHIREFSKKKKERKAFQDKSFFQNMLKTLCTNKICVNEPQSQKSRTNYYIVFICMNIGGLLYTERI